MPYKKLIGMQKFDKKRIAQLWDDCRIFAAWFSSTLKGKKITDKKTGKLITLREIVLKYARARGLLLALGYPIKHKKGGPKPTPAFIKLIKLAKKPMLVYYKYYKGKVSKI